MVEARGLEAVGLGKQAARKVALEERELDNVAVAVPLDKVDNGARRSRPDGGKERRIEVSSRIKVNRDVKRGCQRILVRHALGQRLGSRLLLAQHGSNVGHVGTSSRGKGRPRRGKHGAARINHMRLERQQARRDFKRRHPRLLHRTVIITDIITDIISGTTGGSRGDGVGGG